MPDLERYQDTPHKNPVVLSQTQEPWRGPLAITYQPGLSGLMEIIKRHLPIVHFSKRVKQAILNTPLVAFKCPKGTHSYW